MRGARFPAPGSVPAEPAQSPFLAAGPPDALPASREAPTRALGLRRQVRGTKETWPGPERGVRDSGSGVGASGARPARAGAPAHLPRQPRGLPARRARAAAGGGGAGELAGRCGVGGATSRLLWPSRYISPAGGSLPTSPAPAPTALLLPGSR